MSQGTMSDFRDQFQKNLGSAYVLTSELGGGAMARMFVAEETSLGRRVVVKVLDPELAPGLSAERFARELKLLASLQHPNIVPIISAGVVGGFPYYTMPFVEGMSLKDLLLKEGRLEIASATSLLRDIARALAYAHERGVIHRDIKPGNVLVSHGAAVVADFGIAKAVRAAGSEDPTLTETGTSLGTPAYMAPEQALGDPSTDHRADIYACGVVGYEMLTGHFPFYDRPPHEILAARLAETPPAFTVSRKDIPPSLAAMILRCLKKDPTERPQSAAEILHALEDSRVRPRTLPWRSKFLIRTAGLVGLGLTAVALGIISWRSHQPTVTDEKQPMVAVLPFENQGQASDAYFAEGITDELTSQIGRLPGLGVIARPSSKRAAASGKSLKEIAQLLGVDYILAGSVRWDRTIGGPGRVRVTPELVRVRDGREVWTQSFDASASAVFAVQDSIARHVSAAMASTLSPPGLTKVAAPGTRTFDAYTAYLKGQYELANSSLGFDTVHVNRAITLFRRAITLDSSYALAYYGLHSALMLNGFFRDSLAEEGSRALLTAARLAPNEPVIQIEIARMMTDSGDLERGYALLKRALYEDQNSAVGQIAMANALAVDEGKCADALPYLQRAMELDPTNQVPVGSAAQCAAVTRNYDLARKYTDRGIDLLPSDPLMPWARVGLVASLGGKRDSAKLLLHQVIKRFGIASIGRLELLSDPLRQTQSLLTPSDAEAILSLPIDTAAQPQAAERSGKLLIALAAGGRAITVAYAESSRVASSKAAQRNDNDPEYHYQLAMALAVLGEREKSLSELAQAKSRHMIGNYTPRMMQWVYDNQEASVYALLGERVLATRLLTELVSGPSWTSLVELKGNPAWQSLRGHPAFDTLLQRRNFVHRFFGQTALPIRVSEAK